LKSANPNIEVAIIKERFTVQGLRFRVKQKIEIQKPHFLK
jgi:hypothetical protein